MFFFKKSIHVVPNQTIFKYLVELSLCLNVFVICVTE